METTKPNFLFIQCDQMSALALPFYGHGVVKAPKLARLAGSGVLFENAYCNFPLCAPSRFSMLSGRLASRIGAFDNAAEFPASVPTFVHSLRILGYHTCLVGKMHFAGPDQLHGFEERLTTDCYPADFSWTPTWDAEATKYAFAFGGGVTGVESITDAGVCERSMQLDFDEEVAARAVRKIYDLARRKDAQPFLLAVSFTHPHDPYATTRQYWDLYENGAIDLPSVPALPFEERDAHSRRHYLHIGLDRFQPDEETALKARHGYYAAISYIDDKVGELLGVLESAGLGGNTVVVFTSDHGDMIGERGMWFKQTFYEWAMRVPLIVHAPDHLGARRVAEVVSLLDLFPTLVELAGGGAEDGAGPVDGHSLVGLLRGEESAWRGVVYAEHLSDAAYSPRVMIRRGRHKYVSSPAYAPMLFDLEADPRELDDMAGDPGHAETEAAFADEVGRVWDLDSLSAEILASQRRRRLVQAALSLGRYTPWDFQPVADASRRYVRFRDTFPDVERRNFLPFPLRTE